MKQLTSREANAVLNAISALNVESDLNSLEARFTEALSRLISAEHYTFDFFDSLASRWDSGWNHPEGCYSQEVMVAFGLYFQEHPLLGNFLETGLCFPRKISDFMPTQKFQRLALYNECYRWVDTDAQITVGVPVSPNRILMTTANRKRKDFTESDRRALAALRPHLIANYQTAVALSKFEHQQKQLRGALEISDSGFVLLDQQARLVFMTKRARLWLKEYFSDWSETRSSLPDPVARWSTHYVRRITEPELSSPALPLEITRNGARLQIRLCINHASEQIVLVLEEEQTEICLKTLEVFSLTPREIEIMGWVLRGKTNNEIGFLCDISARTVQKHLEHIFQKFGVETRTAAALLVTEWLRDSSKPRANQLCVDSRCGEE